MDYFVGENVFTLNSGTEFSQFDRLKAFNHHQKDSAVLLTRNYNRMLAHDIEKHHLDPKQVINMYDFFQGAMNVERKEQSLRLLDSIPLTDYHIVGIDNNKSELTYNGKRIGLINVMPETIGLVGSIEYYDSLGQKAVTEYWDWRGFKSMVETYHPDGSVAMQQYLHLDGTPALEVTHMYIGEKVRPTMWKLLDYKGRDRQFRTENQLFTYFMDEIMVDQPGNIISDRRDLDEAVLNAKYGQKFAYVHSVPFKYWDKPTKGVLPAYEIAVNGVGDKKFAKVLVPTEQMASDMKNALADLPDIQVVDDSYVEKVAEPKELNQEITLAYVGRLSEEKNIIDLVKAFKEIHQEIPNTKLQLQGYYSGKDYQEKVEKLIKTSKLTDQVEVVNYSAKQTVDQKADLFINTSNSEGFGMNMLKSMGYGTPVISYGVPYVEGSLIRSDVNGDCVDNRTPKKLAHRVIKVLTNQSLYQKLSAGAIETAKKHDENHFIKSWQDFI